MSENPGRVRKKKNERSSILLMTLWMLSILATFTSYLGYMVQQRVLVVSKIEDNEELHFIAEAGVKRALAEFGASKFSSAFVSLAGNCADNPAAFRDILLGRGNFSVAYEHKDRQSGQTELRFGLIDEERKININYAPVEILSALFRFIGLDNYDSGRLAYAIVDYRDSDTVTRDGIPEEFYYGESGRPPVIKNSNFEIPDEIKLLQGMNKDILAKIANYITVYGAGAVNINTASADILMIMGLSRQLADKVIAFRCGGDGKQDSEDDNYVDDLRSYVARMEMAIPLGDEEKTELESFLLSGLLTTRSNYISASCTAFLNKKNKAVSINCVSDVSGKIYYWTERRYMAVRRLFL